MRFGNSRDYFGLDESSRFVKVVKSRSGAGFRAVQPVATGGGAAEYVTSGEEICDL
jgi:hypothetical protein